MILESYISKATGALGNFSGAAGTLHGLAGATGALGIQEPQALFGVSLNLRDSNRGHSIVGSL